MSERTTGKDIWESMTRDRSSMMARKERLAEATIPSTLPDDNYQVRNEALTNGASSLGAQGATNIVNKLMLAMFAPGVSFMKLELAAREKAAFMQKLQLQDDSLLTDVLAEGEREALRVLEQSGSRPALYEGLSALVCVGDVLMDLSDSAIISFISLRDYAVERNRKGVVLRLVFREITRVQDLEDEAEREYRNAVPTCKARDKVTVYTTVRLTRGMYRSTVYVNEVELSARHSGKWKPENMPYRALAWRLPLGQDYGVSLAEDYSNDLGTHDTVSEALADGSVLAAQFRWACNPGGITQPEDVEGGQNGDVIPADPNDLKLIFANIGSQLQTIQVVEEIYARRLGRGFLMNTAVTRNSERTTAEEVRIQAIELEQSLGGVYSRLAIDMQAPIARWQLKAANINIRGTKISPTILTGLDALSRTAELQRMMGFLGDVNTLAEIPEETRMMLNEEPIISDMAAGRGVNRTKYVASVETINQRRQEKAQAEANQAAVQTGVEAGMQQQVNQAGATQ
ncbi:collar / head-to-tail joining protein [Pseudomonas phage VSW-3]|uniref:Collar / head-to-tail joining protein n=1 Tax=Pseudomonas phage VSW-3 TaxID=1852562 RepID=A0A173GCZ8_9CAUD|nr:collar / head-to-tail joining protein [Pseudomonas phage VSW-3]ANH51095.1 collar / head-to-tail joining protein [Pseudomonas phage VSW-3]